MDKFVKLSAIEKMAKPMESFHGKDESYEEKDSKHMECVCACCGAPCEVCGEEDSEEGYEEEGE